MLSSSWSGNAINKKLRFSKNYMALLIPYISQDKVITSNISNIYLDLPHVRYIYHHSYYVLNDKVNSNGL